jgi:membrane protein DedA with SNARE-associated domain
MGRMVTSPGWLRGSRERALADGNRFFERYGLVAVYFAPSWTAGINGMRARRFVPANAVCALAWALLIGLGSYLFGPSIRDVAQDVGLLGGAIIVALAIATLLGRTRVRHRRASRRQSGARHDGR